MADEITPQDKKPEGGDWKAPASQEELDRIIAARIERERGKYADYEDLKAKAAEYDKATEASKTEIQKALERAEAAEKRAASFEAKEQRAAWATEIVKDSAVPAEALRGSTREELEEHFNLLKPHFTKAAPKRTATPAGKPATGAGESRAVAAIRELRGTA